MGCQCEGAAPWGIAAKAARGAAEALEADGVFGRPEVLETAMEPGPSRQELARLESLQVAKESDAALGLVAGVEVLLVPPADEGGVRGLQKTGSGKVKVTCIQTGQVIVAKTWSGGGLVSVSVLPGGAGYLGVLDGQELGTWGVGGGCLHHLPHACGTYWVRMWPAQRGRGRRRRSACVGW